MYTMGHSEFPYQSTSLFHCVLCKLDYSRRYHTVCFPPWHTIFPFPNTSTNYGRWSCRIQLHMCMSLSNVFVGFKLLYVLVCYSGLIRECVISHTYACAANSGWDFSSQRMAHT
jgi:hypothetical protein